MCGIAALLHSPNLTDLPNWPFWAGANSKQPSLPPDPVSPTDLYPQLTRRGPDAHLYHSLAIPHPSNPNPQTTATALHFIQTTLSHRGTPPHTLALPSGDVLLYNGELYNVSHSPTLNDSCTLLSILSAATSTGKPFETHLLAKLDSLCGPWVFIFWHASHRRLYFARDFLGRRSLLLRLIPNTSLELVSVPPSSNNHGFVEVPPLGLAYVEIRHDLSIDFRLFPRKSFSVLPARFIHYSEGEHVAGSGKEMYVSYLPSRWLRSVKSPPNRRLTLEDSARGFLECFRDSIRRRLVTNRPCVPGCARFAVLFSGGIDSLAIAAILAECLPPEEEVHLINVAFGNCEEDIFRCPDRRSSIAALAELRLLFPKRQFELCCVNVDSKLADESLERSVRHLIYPCDQKMDASIGTALWLAARGEGHRFDHSTEEFSSTKAPNDCALPQTCSTAPILFSGLGADELMGGYKGRHRTIFRTEGEEGIKREMDADLSRLWFRNLGRDDRLVADHGKEIRHPFLDEDLISFVVDLPLTEHVSDLRKPDGIGDKHLLRRAMRILGFPSEACSRSKRAIQFGSRSKQVIERKRVDK